MDPRVSEIWSEMVRQGQETRAERRVLWPWPEYLRDLIAEAMHKSPDCGGLVITGPGVPDSYLHPAKTSQAKIAWLDDQVVVQVLRVRAQTNRQLHAPRAVALRPKDARDLVEALAGADSRQTRIKLSA